MIRQNKPKTSPDEDQPMATTEIRIAKRSDAKEMADLIVRLKRLNNEFDPLFGVVEDARQRAERYLAGSFDPSKTLLMVATSGEKIIGVVRAELRERLFYEPSKEGHITDMYILPEHRRKQLGRDLLDRTVNELKKMGAEIIVADLPSQNEIGVHFYMKRGFRRLTESFAQMP